MKKAIASSIPEDILSTDKSPSAADPRLDDAVRLPKAVLWDMDGTLVDTEPYWIDTEYALAAEYGSTWSEEQALTLVGSDLLSSGVYIREQMGLDLTPREIVERLLDGVVERVRAEVPWRPGAPELLAALRASGVPNVLVTMSWRRFVDPVLAQLPAGSFETTIAGDEVSHGKPHPEPYLAAARALAIAPGECIAIEDSPTGARSAQAAGCQVVVVPLHVEVSPEPGRVILGTLAGLTPSALAASVR